MMTAPIGLESQWSGHQGVTLWMLAVHTTPHHTAAQHNTHSNSLGGVAQSSPLQPRSQKHDPVVASHFPWSLQGSGVQGSVGL